MGGFFQALATKLAERWTTLLLVPGAIFVAALWIGAHLGQTHALDWHTLNQHVATITTAVARQPGATQALLAVVVLLAATGVGLSVQALAGVTRSIWLGQWPHPFVRLRQWRVNRRLGRWRRRLDQRRALEHAHPHQSRTDEQQQQINVAADRINRVSWAEPGRPTWMGDRIHSVERIALNRCGLDLASAWPRLWLVLPDTARAELTAAHAAFAAAVATGTWAWPYLLLGIAWWPAAIAGIGIGITGWVRARTAIAELAGLTEAVLDLHGRALATALGVAEQNTVGPLSPDEGQALNTLFRKGR